MSFRRQPLDRVNPRFVPPSRHTIFIRGLPGSTNVDSVKNHFSSETSSKCTVEFFSTSEDKVRFSVAIRFKSHETAREMLEKYNGKELLGHPVEVTWFKDLKKARARVYEEQRHSRFRAVRGGFRGNHRGFPDRRGRAYSPNRTRERSYSGGPPSGRRFGSRPSVSSHSSSRSRVGSTTLSPKRRRLAHDLENDSMQANEGISRMSRGRFRKSRSASSRSRSSSHSISNRSLSNRGNVPPRRGSFPYRGSAIRQSGQGGKSPENTRSSFSNAPLVSGGEREGSGLLSGLIQLSSKRLQSQPPQFRESASRSRSVSSRSSSKSASPRRQHQRQKHHSPILTGLLPKNSKSPSLAKELKPSTVLTGSNWRPVNFSEEAVRDSAPSGSLFAAYSGKPTVANSKIILSPLITHKAGNKLADMDTDNSSRSRRSSRSSSNRSHRQIEASPPTIEKPVIRAQNKSREETAALEMTQMTPNSKGPKDKQTLIQDKKVAIEEEYKKDCETFATVVKTLISKDNELEERLLPLLKKILHERGQRSIEDLRVYIESVENGNAGALD
ncbi:Dentin sialophosphoprotein [Echinococcus multilocularis]|uniref:Dentin sialophosphoprotein n=1 Tax=Echinococcus multilocularis TaxID=6211 RepID=A0A068YCE1_ECHMU|nr:Dentin sialophosphoprotein [Echinococcus multilocularis]